LYIHGKRKPNSFLNDLLIVKDRINEIFKVSDHKIFANGRSLGISPAFYLSSQR